ncbi:hypothetical protein [Streptomyces sp. NPDC000229]
MHDTAKDLGAAVALLPPRRTPAIRVPPATRRGDHTTHATASRHHQH